MIGEPFQVLDGGGQEELISGAGQAPQSEPYHREDLLGLTKEPFDLLALGAGELIGLGLHQRLGVLAGFLIDIALDPARRRGGTASRFQGAALTIELAGAVIKRLAVMNPAGRLQGLAAGTDIEITLLVIAEVRPREGAIITLALVPDRDVRVLVEMVDARGVEGRGAALDAVHHIALVQEELGEIRTVLAGNAGNQRGSP